MSPRPPQPVGFDLLRAKYAEMLAMRLEHDAGVEVADGVRIRMSELARRYPGALREIDELPLDEIRARIAALETALLGETEAAEWMEAMGLFHAMMRGALCVKRWLAGRKQVDADTARSFAMAVDGFAFPEDARVWQGELARLASPPGGRVSAVVFERVARHLGATEARVRHLIFGVSRRRPRRDR